MKRKLKWLVIVLAVSLLGFGTALLLWPRDRITVESWQNIRIGMTEKEVVEILGGPGMTNEEANAQYEWLKKELRRPAFEFEDMNAEGNWLFGRTGKIWTGRRGRIEIEFDQDNHVCWKAFQGGRWIKAGILDRLRDWLGL